MTGEFIVAKLKNLEPIEGADMIQQGKIFGERVIIPSTHKEGEIGILFDCETQLSEKYVHYNNLYRKEKMNYDKEKTGYIEEKRRVKPIKLRGVKCSGLWMPLESLKNIPELKDYDLSKLREGNQDKSIDGVDICDKYIPPRTRTRMRGNKDGRIKINKIPTFREHVDTDQFMRNTHELTPNEFVVVTEKLHGTSGRVGYLPTNYPLKWYEKLFKPLFSSNRINEQKYSFVVGSRRVVKSIEGEKVENKNHFYSEDLWTEIGGAVFKGKLNKGETVYFEIVGYAPDGAPIMPSQSNEALKNFMDKKEYKNFIKKYGDTTYFRYGCFEMEHDGAVTNTAKKFRVFIYRITQSNEDGVSYDLSWDQVKIRCEELGVDHVPELHRTIISEEDLNDDRFVALIEKLADESSKNFPEHIREGVVVRIENGKKTPIFLKHKSFVFKVLEGLIKEADVVDIEESN